jgi:hypothetical protein
MTLPRKPGTSGPVGGWAVREHPPQLLSRTWSCLELDDDLDRHEALLSILRTLTRDESGPSTLLPDCQHVHDGELPLIALSGADAQPG